MNFSVQIFKFYLTSWILYYILAEYTNQVRYYRTVRAFFSINIFVSFGLILIFRFASARPKLTNTPVLTALPFNLKRKEKQKQK